MAKGVKISVVTRWTIATRFGLMVSLMAMAISCAASSGENEETRQAASNDSGEEDDYGFFTPIDYSVEYSDARRDFSLVEGEDVRHSVATWHANDVGFALEGNPVVLFAEDLYAAHPDVPVNCYTFQLLGSWDDGVELFFEADGEYGIFGMSAQERSYLDEFGDDPDVEITSEFEGTSHYSKKLDGRDWNLNEFEVRTLKHRGKLDFSIRKSGEGEALFYFIRINGQQVCAPDAIEVD